MNFNDFLITQIDKGGDKMDSFLNRQCAIREFFKGKGEEISWLLDLTFMLFLIKNFKVEGAHFKLKKSSLQKAKEYSNRYEELSEEHKLITHFLK